MEHVLLAFVCWQDAPSNGSSGSFWSWQRCISRCTHPPQRLDSWLPGDAPITSHSIEETRGASTPSHTPDLVKSAASWAPTRVLSGVAHAPNPFAQSRDGERVAPPTLKLTPRHADSLRKRMDLPANFIRIQVLLHQMRLSLLRR